MNATVELIRLYAKQLKLPPSHILSSCFGRLSPTTGATKSFSSRCCRQKRAEKRESTEKADQSGQVSPAENTGYLEFENLEHVKPETVWSLADNGYIRRRENIICMGNPGMGKTHLR